jgi:hypothetical protein
MTGVVVPITPTDVDAFDDPAAQVVTALEGAKVWLERALVVDLPEIVEVKMRAEAVRSYVAQKHLGKEAELAAAEIVRRAERRIGQLVRAGQELGEVRRRGEHEHIANQHGAVGANGTNCSPKLSTDSMFTGSRDRADVYAMTDGVSADEFEEAIGAAKSEENLSRRNVVRKVQAVKEQRSAPTREDRVEQVRRLAAKAATSQQIAAAIGVKPDVVRRLAAEEHIEIKADEVIGRVRRIDSNRIVHKTVDALEALASTVAMVEFDCLEADDVAEWVASLRRSLRTLQRFTKELAG